MPLLYYLPSRWARFWDGTFHVIQCFYHPLASQGINDGAGDPPGVPGVRHGAQPDQGGPREGAQSFHT